MRLYNDVNQASPVVRMTGEDIEIMLVHLLRCPDVFLCANDKVDPELFVNQNELIYKLIWRFAQEFFFTHKVPITKMYLLGQMINVFNVTPELSMYRDHTQTLIDWVFSVNKDDLVPEAGFAYLQRFLDERVVHATTMVGVMMSAQDAVDAVNKAFVRTRVDSAKSTDIFDFNNPAFNAVLTPVQPTGSALFDRLIGGVRPGHMTGILAPTGAGKTTACNDLVVNIAKLKKVAMYFQYEQGVAKDIRPRLLACATAIPSNVFATTPFNMLSDDIRKRLIDLEYLRDYMLIYDMQDDKQGYGGAAEIETLIINQRAKGVNPSVVVVDWLGLVVHRQLAAKNIVPESDKLQGCYAQNLTKLREIANKYMCEVVVAHQLNADAGRRGSDSRPTVYDASEYRRFSQTMDSCFILGKPDHRGISRAYTDKNRGQATEFMIRNHGDTSRFDVLDGQMVAVTDMSGRATFVSAAGVMA